jgi:hypothetical protein
MQPGLSIQITIHKLLFSRPGGSMDPKYVLQYLFSENKIANTLATTRY